MNTIEQKPVWRAAHKFSLAAVLAIQFAIAYAIGEAELLANTQFAMIPPIAVTVIIPVALFLAAYVLSARFRSFVLAQDIRTLTMMQHWRVIGFAFLAFYAFDILPALFAWPAGLGDVAIGLAAAQVLAHNHSFAQQSSNKEKSDDRVYLSYDRNRTQSGKAHSRKCTKKVWVYPKSHGSDGQFTGNPGGLHNVDASFRAHQL